MRTLQLPAIFLMALAGFAQAGESIFIGFGIDKYDHSKNTNLIAASNDIDVLGQVFEGAGFRVFMLTSSRAKGDSTKAPTKANIEAMLDKALAGRKKDDLVVFAIAAHGMQFGNDPDVYICPQDGVPFPEKKGTLMSVGSIYKRFEMCGASAKILLADCCRNDPDTSRGRSAGELLEKSPPPGVMAVFACSRNERAYEDKDLRHGVFFYHLLEGLRGKAASGNDEVDFERLWQYVRKHVPLTVGKLGMDITQNPKLQMNFSGPSLVLLNRASVELSQDWRDYQRAGNEGGRADDFFKERGPKRANSWQRSAEGNSAFGMVLVGECLRLGCGVEKDFSKAFELFSKAAEKGNSSGMYYLGICYHNAIGVSKDERKAFEWYAKAAENSLSEAMINVAWCYHNAFGVSKDEKKAFDWYSKGAELGNRWGMCNLGNCYKDAIGVESDSSKAFEWHSKAANLGLSTAMNNVGTCYLAGRGIAKDDSKAFKWFSKSANLGHGMAMNNVGWCCENGLGVSQNLTQAVQWYRKAAAKDIELAKKNLRRLGQQ